MQTLKLTQIGDALGVILPEEILSRLKLGKGDTVVFTEMPVGYHLTSYNPDTGEQLVLGREFMREFRDTFHELAK